MAEVLLTRGPDGKLIGATEADQRRWAKFLARCKTLEQGDTLKAKFTLPRSPGFHKRHFLILAALFASQDQFVEFEKFRAWAQVGAGFCDLVPGPKGGPVAISRSIAWEDLDDADFAEHHAAVIAFVRTTHFTRFLWPHLSDLDADTLVNAVLMEFN